MELTEAVLSDIYFGNVADLQIADFGAVSFQALTDAIANAPASAGGLRSLGFSGISMGDARCATLIETLAASQHTQLGHLNLASTHAGPLTCRSMVNLCEKMRTLRSINLSRNDLTDCIDEVAQAVKRCTSLTHIALDSCGLKGDAVLSVATAINSNPSLRAVTITSNGVEADGALYFADALKSHPSLREVNLNDNLVGDAGATFIAEALKFNTRLRALGLARNDLTVDGAVALADALRSNRTLLALDLAGNLVSAQGGSVFTSLLRANTTLTQLQLKDNDIKDDIVKAVVEALDRRDQQRNSSPTLLSSPRATVTASRNGSPPSLRSSRSVYSPGRSQGPVLLTSVYSERSKRCPSCSPPRTTPMSPGNASQRSFRSRSASRSPTPSRRSAGLYTDYSRDSSVHNSGFKAVPFSRGRQGQGQGSPAIGDGLSAIRPRKEVRSVSPSKSGGGTFGKRGYAQARSQSQPSPLAQPSPLQPPRTPLAISALQSRAAAVVTQSPGGDPGERSHDRERLMMSVVEESLANQRRDKYHNAQVDAAKRRSQTQQQSESNNVTSSPVPPGSAPPPFTPTPNNENKQGQTPKLSVGEIALRGLSPSRMPLVGLSAGWKPVGGMGTVGGSMPTDSPEGGGHDKHWYSSSATGTETTARRRDNNYERDISPPARAPALPVNHLQADALPLPAPSSPPLIHRRPVDIMNDSLTRDRDRSSRVSHGVGVTSTTSTAPQTGQHSSRGMSPSPHREQHASSPPVMATDTNRDTNREHATGDPIANAAPLSGKAKDLAAWEKHLREWEAELFEQASTTAANATMPMAATVTPARQANNPQQDYATPSRFAGGGPDGGGEESMMRSAERDAWHRELRDWEQTLLRREAELADRLRACTEDAEAMDMLQSRLQDDNVELTSREEELKEWERDLNARQASLTETMRSSDAAADQAERALRDAKSKSDDLTDRMEAVKRAEAELAQKSKQLSAREDKLKDKEKSVLQSSKSTGRESKQLRDMKAVLKQREETLSDNEKALTRRAEMLQQKEQDLKQRTRSVVKDSKALSDANKTMGERETAIKEREAELDRLLQEVETSRAEATAKLASLNKAKERVAVAETELENERNKAAQDAIALDQHKRELEVWSETLHQSEVDMRDKYREQTSVTSEMMSQTRALQQTLNNKERATESKLSELDKRERALQLLVLELQGQERELRAKEEAFAQNRAQAADSLQTNFETRMELLEGSLRQRESELDARESELGALQESLVQSQSRAGMAQSQTGGGGMGSDHRNGTTTSSGESQAAGPGTNASDSAALQEARRRAEAAETESVAKSVVVVELQKRAVAKDDVIAALEMELSVLRKVNDAKEHVEDGTMHSQLEEMIQLRAALAVAQQARSKLVKKLAKYGESASPLTSPTFSDRFASPVGSLGGAASFGAGASRGSPFTASKLDGSGQFPSRIVSYRSPTVASANKARAGLQAASKQQHGNNKDEDDAALEASLASEFAMDEEKLTQAMKKRMQAVEDMATAVQTKLDDLDARDAELSQFEVSLGHKERDLRALEMQVHAGQRQVEAQQEAVEKRDAELRERERQMEAGAAAASERELMIAPMLADAQKKIADALARQQDLDRRDEELAAKAKQQSDENERLVTVGARHIDLQAREVRLDEQARLLATREQQLTAGTTAINAREASLLQREAEVNDKEQHTTKQLEADKSALADIQAKLDQLEGARRDIEEREATLTHKASALNEQDMSSQKEVARLHGVVSGLRKELEMCGAAIKQRDLYVQEADANRAEVTRLTLILEQGQQRWTMLQVELDEVIKHRDLLKVEMEALRADVALARASTAAVSSSVHAESAFELSTLRERVRRAEANSAAANAEVQALRALQAGTPHTSRRPSLPPHSNTSVVRGEAVAVATAAASQFEPPQDSDDIDVQKTSRALAYAGADGTPLRASSLVSGTPSRADATPSGHQKRQIAPNTAAKLTSALARAEAAEVALRESRAEAARAHEEAMASARLIDLLRDEVTATLGERDVEEMDAALALVDADAANVVQSPHTALAQLGNANARLESARNNAASGGAATSESVPLLSDVPASVGSLGGVANYDRNVTATVQPPFDPSSTATPSRHSENDSGAAKPLSPSSPGSYSQLVDTLTQQFRSRLTQVAVAQEQQSMHASPAVPSPTPPPRRAPLRQEQLAITAANAQEEAAARQAADAKAQEEAHKVYLLQLQEGPLQYDVFQTLLAARNQKHAPTSWPTPPTQFQDDAGAGMRSEATPSTVRENASKTLFPNNLVHALVDEELCSFVRQPLEEQDIPLLNILWRAQRWLVELAEVRAGKQKLEEVKHVQPVMRALWQAVLLVCGAERLFDVPSAAHQMAVRRPDAGTCVMCLPDISFAAKVRAPKGLWAKLSLAPLTPGQAAPKGLIAKKQLLKTPLFDDVKKRRGDVLHALQNHARWYHYGACLELGTDGAACLCGTERITVVENGFSFGCMLGQLPPPHDISEANRWRISVLEPVDDPIQVARLLRFLVQRIKGSFGSRPMFVVGHAGGGGDDLSADAEEDSEEEDSEEEESDHGDGANMAPGEAADGPDVSDMPSDPMSSATSLQKARAGRFVPRGDGIPRNSDITFQRPMSMLPRFLDSIQANDDSLV